MTKSLIDSVQEPSGTQSAIMQAMRSPAGMRVVWVVVEAEDDCAVYGKFLNPSTTIVKTSESPEGRKSYVNVQLIVRNIREEVPKAHIIGIRDADYSKYRDDFAAEKNIFLTDRRDLELMMLETESVCQELEKWMGRFEESLKKSLPICRHFGYLRIYNDVFGLSCRFHDNLRTNMFWDFSSQTLKEGWKKSCTQKFVMLSEERCSEESLEAFIDSRRLEQESDYDICRGHDLLPMLSLNMIDVQTYSISGIMLRMITSYSLEDFKRTRLYENIHLWQESENVEALLA